MTREREFLLEMAGIEAKGRRAPRDVRRLKKKARQRQARALARAAKKRGGS